MRGNTNIRAHDPAKFNMVNDLYQIGIHGIPEIARLTDTPLSTVYRWLAPCECGPRYICRALHIHPGNFSKYRKVKNLGRQQNLTLPEMARRSGVSERTVRNWLRRKQGNGTVKVVSRHIKVYPAALKLWHKRYHAALIAQILGLSARTVEIWLRREREARGFTSKYPPLSSPKGCNLTKKSIGPVASPNRRRKANPKNGRGSIAPDGFAVFNNLKKLLIIH